MIAVDTNVLARFLLEDNKEDHARATAILAEAIEEAGLFIPSSAFIELTWLLDKKRWSNERVCEALETLFAMQNVRIGMQEAVKEALKLYRSGKADFGDYLMLAESRMAGAKFLASFDATLCREQPRFVRSPAKG